MTASGATALTATMILAASLALGLSATELFFTGYVSVRDARRKLAWRLFLGSLGVFALAGWVEVLS